jgi:tetratricopeptide (TPR) repeat protein
VGRANFILARADLMNGKMQDAQSEFEQAVVKGQDPRTVAWSHIFLGRILDVEGERSQAIAQYKLALATSDGRDDTQQAAQSGLKKPFTVPSVPSSGGDDTGKPAGGTSSSGSAKSGAAAPAAAASSDPSDGASPQ